MTYRPTQKIRPKQIQDSNVLDAALERIEYIFQSFDRVVVSFSGGKDSTVVLCLARMVAQKMGKLPLEVVFFDEEVITPPTDEYCRRLAQDSSLNFRWFCIPIKQRNACSFDEPYWYSWDPSKRELWTRQPPDCAIMQLPEYVISEDTETGVADAMDALYTKRDGKVCVLTGIRTEESMRRYRSVARLKNDAYINSRGKGKDKNIFSAHPIYDWKATDVWLAIRRFGWDYNTTYDIFNLTTLNGKYLRQRVCPPFGEEPLRTLNLYQECFPDMFDAMTRRVPGVGSAIRYANDGLYGNNLKSKPEGIGWRDYLLVILQNYSDKQHGAIVAQINSAIALHYKKSILQIEEEDPDPISGISWKSLCRIALRGDFKTRLLTTLNKDAERSKKAKGLSFDQVVERYATEDFKTKFYERHAKP